MILYRTLPYMAVLITASGVVGLAMGQLKVTDILLGTSVTFFCLAAYSFLRGKAKR